MSTELPAAIRADIERYFALYGPPEHPALMADAFTGHGRGDFCYDEHTGTASYTPYPDGTYTSALAYIMRRTAETKPARS